ncbi:MAG: SEC-C domain-containing protein [Planctomycetota bacterium]|nr:SEC-C domain-containing protein [Planctomycetota bacterium]
MGMKEYELLQEKAERALALMGDPAAIDLIRTRFLRSSWEFKLYAGGVLGAIHEELAEETILGLLKWERDLKGRCCLCIALGDQFSRAAIEIIQRELQDDAIADEHVRAEFNEILLAMSLALGVGIPRQKELLRWRTAQDKRIQDFEDEMKDRLPMLDALEMEDVDWDDEEDWDREDEFGASPDDFPENLPSPVEPLVAKPQPRPNDPCPCGSGKKFKKCCGTR